MSDRLLRACLRLLPAEFRGEYGREMLMTFRADAAGVRGPRRLWLYLATMADIVRTAPGEHADILQRDLRFALRSMARSPVQAASAVVTLALGIGANAAMFAVVHGVLLAPLPYRDADTLVMVQEQREGGEPGNLGYLTFADLQARSRTVTSMAAATQSFATLDGQGRDPERVSAMRVSATYFDLVGVQPVLGRGFTAAEDRPGEARRVAVLSHDVWRRRFDGDPAIIGRPISVGTQTHVVVGVMPAGFTDLVAGRLYDGAEMWFPLGYDPAAAFACRTCRHLRVMARLAPGQSADDAARELTALMVGLAGQFPSQYSVPSVVVRPLGEFFLGPVRTVLLVLWAGVGLLFVVACINVANLQLLRATERAHEIAVRAALGVTRARLVRQLMTEALLLAALGGAGGVALAAVALRLVGTWGPAQLPRLETVTLDLRVALVAVGMAAVSGLAFGLAPLRGLKSAGMGAALAGAGVRTASAIAWRTRAALVGANVAAAVVLLVTAGLLVRSTLVLLAVAPGFEPEGVLTMRVLASGPRFSAGETDAQIDAVSTFYSAVTDRVRSLPGVQSASAVSLLPLAGGRDQFGLHIAGRPQANPEDAPNATRFVVREDYFRTLQIPLVRGRLFDARDGRTAPRVAVINRATAEALFAGEDPIGHEVMLGPATAPRRTIVGVVGDVRHDGLDAPVDYQVYVPHDQWAWAEPMMSLVIRTAGDPLAQAAAVRQVLREVDRTQPVTGIAGYASLVGESTATRRFAAGLLGAFAGSALLLTCVGLYGVLGFMVERRRQEMGVRQALGAGRGVIARMVVRQGMWPVAMGLAVGLALASLVAGSLRALLFGIEVWDPLTFVAAIALLAAASLAACAVPALRAARVEPAVALRA